MEENTSILGKKESNSFFTYDFIGTDKMVTYSQTNKKLHLLIKDGMYKGKILLEIDTGIPFTYEQFLVQAKSIFTEIINRSEYFADHKTSLS